MDAIRIESKCLQEFPKENPSPSCMKIATGVMAIARVATTDQNCVGTVFKGFDYQIKVDSSGAGQTNDPKIRRIFQSARTGKVGTKVGTPVANKGNDFRFKIGSVNHNATFCTHV